MKLMVYAVQFKGGSVQVIVALLREFVKFSENEYYVILSKEIKSQIARFEFPDNFHFYDLPCEAGSSSANLKVRNKYFSKLESEIKPDCGLCSSGPLYHKTQAPLLMGYNLPHHIYRDSPYFKTNTIASKIRWFARRVSHRYLFRKEASVCFVQTDDVNKRLRKFLNKDNVITISNTYNTAYNNPMSFPNKLPKRSPGEIRMLTIASYYPHKNLGIIKDVLEELKKRGIDNYRFVVTLSDDYYDKLFGDAFRDKIYNAGFVPAVEGPSLYNECDIMFLPTLLECFSASYAEAMVMGKPIITSDMSFAHVVCENAAMYFDPMSPIDIADKLIYLVEHNEMQDNLVKKGKEHLSQFGTSEDRAIEVLRICSDLANKYHG